MTPSGAKEAGTQAAARRLVETCSANSRGTRRRGAQLEDALLDAAWGVLIESGYSGLTYDAIATRAETSRAVLYRRWPQRHLLLEAALRRAWTPVALPNTGNLREDAIALLRTINSTRGELIIVLIQQLGDYYRETGNSLEQLRQIIGVSDRKGSFESLVARAVERGEVAAAPRAKRIMHLPLDLLRQDMMMHNGPDSDDALIEIIDHIWLPLLHG